MGMERNTLWIGSGLLLAAVAAAVLSGCGGAPPPTPEGWKRYEFDEQKCSLAAPSGWTHQDAGMAQVLLSPSDATAFRENVNVVREKLPSSLSASVYRDKSLQSMQAMLPGYEQLDTGETRLGGREAAYIAYRHRMGGQDLRVLAFLVTRGTSGYVVTCTATGESFDRYEDTFRKIADTFHAK